MTQIQTPAPRTRHWLPLTVIAAAAVAVTILTVVAVTSGSDDPSPAGWPPFQAEAQIESPLESAATDCATGSLADENKTLVIDMAGEDYGSGDATVSDLGCVLDELAAPQSVVAKMDSTRALDGMQSGTWDSYEATWTYHPSNGLDVILTETD